MNYYLLRPSQDGETSTGRKFHCSSLIILDCLGNSFVEKKKELQFVEVIAWFVVIFGINTASDISKLLYVISRAVRRVKFETILKYH